MRRLRPRRALTLLTILLALSFASAGGPGTAAGEDAGSVSPGPPLPSGGVSPAPEGAADRDAGPGGPASEVNFYNGTGNPTANITTSMGTIKIELYVNLVPVTANNFIKLTVEGPGRLLGMCGGDPRSHELAKSPVMRAFNGLLLAIVQSADEPGPITLVARSAELAETRIELTAIA